MVDAPIAQLVKDLAECRRLEKTLIIVATEFSRDILMEGRPELSVIDQVKQPDVINELKHYGMNRPFTDGCNKLMFSVSVKERSTYGKTA